MSLVAYRPRWAGGHTLPMPLDNPNKARNLDFLIRTITSAVLAVAIVGAVIYQSIAGEQVSTDLLGWGGIVIGAYIAQHARLEGIDAGRASSDHATLTEAAVQAMDREPPK